MKNSYKKYVRTFIRGWVGSIFIALLIATSVKSSIADWYIVPTGSMKPTIIEGDRIFTNRLAYDLKLPYTTFHIASWSNPDRGDVVVFNSPVDKTRLVKRVVGIPGDIISMKNNQLIINGKKLTYEEFQDVNDAFGKEKLPGTMVIENLTGHEHLAMVTSSRRSIHSFPPIQVPDDQYFMMGDNRDNSADSRYFGFVNRKEILGQATAVVISLDLKNHYRPRWKRFFTALN